MLAHLLLFLLSTLVLIKSVNVLVRALTRIAIFFRLSEFTVGFILMALATSLPELFVGITAAAEGVPSLSLGNVVGSNIADLTLVIGVVTLVSRGFRVESNVRKKDAFYMAALALAPLILLWDKTLSRNDGVLLLLLYTTYLFRLFSQRFDYTKRLDHFRGDGSLPKEIFLFILGVVFLLGSAEGLVRAAESLGRDLDLPLVLIGLVGVALGTSLPELAFEIEAILKHHNPMVLGDLLGSVVTNSSLVLGVTALISPIEITYFGLFEVSALFLILTLLVFVTFIRSQSKLSLTEGLGLILLYISFLLIEFSLQSRM